MLLNMNILKNFSGFSQWQDLFDENVSNAWKEESFSSLKNISMLLFCLAKEIRKVHYDMRKEVLLLKEGKSKYENYCESFITDAEYNKSPAGKTKNQHNESQVKLSDSGSLSLDEFGSIVISEGDMPGSSETKSPEIKKKRRLKSFRRKLGGKAKRKLLSNDATPESLLGDVVINQDDSIIKETGSKTNASCTSTESDSLNKYLDHNPLKILQESDHDLDFSVVQCTPPPVLVFKGKQKRKHSSLVQKSLKNYQFNRKIRSNDSNKKLSDNKKEQEMDSAMGITNMVSYLNKESPIESDKHNSNIDSITYLSSDHFTSDKTKMDESDNLLVEENACANLNEFLAEAQSVPNQSEAAPVIRGKERQKLPGWSCKNCEKFYLQQGLNSNQIVTLIKCSKHRGYYKPREDTLPGYWDMYMSSQEKENNN